MSILPLNNIGHKDSFKFDMCNKLINNNTYNNKYLTSKKFSFVFCWRKLKIQEQFTDRSGEYFLFTLERFTWIVLFSSCNASLKKSLMF